MGPGEAGLMIASVIFGLVAGQAVGDWAWLRWGGEPHEQRTPATFGTANGSLPPSDRVIGE